MVVVADIPAVSQGHGGGSVLFHEISTLERMGKLDAIIQSGKELGKMYQYSITLPSSGI